MVVKKGNMRKETGNNFDSLLYRHGEGTVIPRKRNAISCTKRVSQMFRRSRIESAMTGQARKDGKRWIVVVSCPVSKKGRT